MRKIVVWLAVAGVAVAAAGCATGSGQTEDDERINEYDSGWLPVAESPTRGPDDAVLTVILFNDLLCETCGRAAKRVAALRNQRDDVRVVYKFYPADKPSHRLAARAAAYAHEQGAFWRFYDAVRNNRATVAENPRAELAAIGERVGLDPDGLADALEQRDENPEEWPSRVIDDISVGRDLGLSGPPAVFVNGRMIRPGGLGRLDTVVASAREEADRLMKGDVGLGRLYQTAAGLAYERQGLRDVEMYRDPIRISDQPARVGEDSEKVPIGESPVLGPADARVTIVEYSDFQCPFCQKGYERIKKLRENFPDEVRVVFKHFPLPFHKNAKPAARVAMAAGEQGEEYFWEMHDRLFERQSEWKKDDVADVAADWAREIEGLDVEQLRRDLRDNASTYNKRIDDDQEQGKELGVKGTPHFFINGEAISGAQPYSRFESIVESKLRQAKELMRAKEVDRSNIYRVAVEKNFDDSPRDRRDEKKRKKKKDKRKQTKVEYVPVDADDAVTGANADEALVTVVEFSDFECPFCDKVKPTVEKLKKNYGDKVRFVYKHKPLPMHDKAKPAARAAIAAQKQGKFWEMHDLLFENQKEWKKKGEQAFFELAKELGLDVETFKKDFRSDAVKKRVEEDLTLAKKIGASGTPNFWINGVNVVGAQPYSKFESVIDEQIARAKKVEEEKDVTGEELYKKVVARNEVELSQGDDGDQAGDERKRDDSNRVDTSKLKIDDSPTRGPKDAPVTIYMFSDFECPFCAKSHSTVEKVMKNYEGKVRLVYKHFPIEQIHSNAVPAAKAAMAAGEQGKFWEMYDKIYENQKHVGQDGIYEQWASELGLDVDQFESDMDDVSKSDIMDDKKMGSSVGIRGTPGFVINGRRVTGAQPYSKFESIIEEELDGEEDDSDGDDDE